MRIPLTIRQLIWLILATVIATFLLSALTQSLISFSLTGADWVSASIQALGNVSGGIIGGIVAIVVATYQVNKALLNEQNKQLRTTVTMLKLINEELRDNIGVLGNAVPLATENIHLLKTQLSDDMWKSTVIHLVVSDDLLVRLNVCYRKVNLIRNLSEEDINDNILTETKDQINYTLGKSNEEIRKIECEIL